MYLTRVGHYRLGSTVFSLMAALTAPARTASAAALSWNNAAGGSAATSTNWTPNAVPGAADDLTFAIAGAYSVTWNSTVASSRTHTYRSGTVTNTMSSPHTAGSGITVGQLAGDSAAMTLTTGSLTSSTNLVVGQAGGSSGTVNVNDDDADLIIGGGADLTIGNSGNGTLNVTGTGHVQVADQFIVGSNSTSLSTVTISGFSLVPIGRSFLEVLGVNDSRIGQGGDVTMTISNGAAADFAANLIIANGSASNTTVTVEDVGFLDSALRVDGDLLIGRNISAGIAAGTGTLNVNTGGQVTVQGDTFLGDPDTGTGTIVLGGGRFNGALPVNMETGSAITGTGTMNADVNVGAGSIVATTAAGITMQGIINHTGAAVFGTRIHFGSTGGYNGSGSCAVEITGDPTAQITATGPLTLGRNVTTGVNYDGMLDVGTQDVTLVDSNGAVMGGLTTISSGGNLRAPSGLGVELGGRIQGQGAVTANVLMSGTLDPQRSGTPGGVMQITGNLTMNPSGSVAMEIGGTPPSSQHDRVNVTGTAGFNGTMQVTLPTGYVPKVGEQFIAVNATAGRSGTFASIVPPAPPPCNGVTFVMVYSSTAAIVLIRPPLGCTALGDLNSDGSCNGPDIQIFINSILLGPYNSCADMNGDCVNSASDVPIFVNCLL